LVRILGALDTVCSEMEARKSSIYSFLAETLEFIQSQLEKNLAGNSEGIIRGKIWFFSLVEKLLSDLNHTEADLEKRIHSLRTEALELVSQRSKDLKLFFSHFKFIRTATATDELGKFQTSIKLLEENVKVSIQNSLMSIHVLKNGYCSDTLRALLPVEKSRENLAMKVQETIPSMVLILGKICELNVTYRSETNYINCIIVGTLPLLILRPSNRSCLTHLKTFAR
jgi:hypothetical protein